MEFIQEYFDVFVIIAIALVIIFLVYTAKNIYKISKYFSSRRFKVTSLHEVDPIDMTEHFSVGIFNNNINDSRVVALGLVYKNKNIDYFQSYLHQKSLGNDSKIVIPSRDSIRLKIVCPEIVTIIRNLNDGTKRTKKISVFVIDSLGITTITKAKAIRKNIKKMISKQIEKEKIEKRNAHKLMKQERRDSKKENRQIKRAMRKEKVQNFWLRVKAKFKKK